MTTTTTNCYAIACDDVPTEIVRIEDGRVVEATAEDIAAAAEIVAAIEAAETMDDCPTVPMEEADAVIAILGDLHGMEYYPELFAVCRVG